MSSRQVNGNAARTKSLIADPGIGQAHLSIGVKIDLEFVLPVRHQLALGLDSRPADLGAVVHGGASALVDGKVGLQPATHSELVGPIFAGDSETIPTGLDFKLAAFFRRRGGFCCLGHLLVLSSLFLRDGLRGVCLGVCLGALVVGRFGLLEILRIRLRQIEEFAIADFADGSVLIENLKDGFVQILLILSLYPRRKKAGD